jgi:hypothetical protein
MRQENNMSATMNSSGSANRFSLAGGEDKSFEVQAPGGSQWTVELVGEIQQDMQGVLTGGPATVTLSTSEDGVAWTAVGSVTVVAGGRETLAGKTGRYAKIDNGANGAYVHVHARASARVQPLKVL